MEKNVWQELEKRKALKALVFDSIDERLKNLIARIDLKSIGGKEVCIILFNHPLALQEWKREEKQTLEKMRVLYKQRGLKDIVVFSKVLSKVSFKPTPKSEREEQKEQTYKERATGEFKIKATDESLKACFESIKELIKHNRLKEREWKN